MADAVSYSIILSLPSLQRIVTYKKSLISDDASPGCYLMEQLIKWKSENAGLPTLEEIPLRKFIEMILATKKPLKFAESDVKLDGTDWNREEFKILGDINVATPVEIYDNGVWSVGDKNFQKYEKPHNGELLFTPGALLGARMVRSTPDYEEVASDGRIEQNKYNGLIERRVAPLLVYASEKAKEEGKKAIVTVPGIGCGAFAGRFRGTVGKHLNQALKFVAEKYAHLLVDVSCIYFDPFGECDNETEIIKNIIYKVRPYMSNQKSQLNMPEEYAESQEDFSNCKLFKIVAWDHASYPGNDFYINHRFTDDGVSAAATNSMKIITGTEGVYKNGKYEPLNCLNWKQVVNDKKIYLKADNIIVISETNIFTLEEAESCLEKNKWDCLNCLLL